MKYVVIGAAGHFNQALEAARMGLADMPAAIAPGCESEDITKLKEMSGAAAYGDYRAMLDEIRPDIAVVNSWYGYNASITRECFERGIHVYSEKPLATSYDDLILVENAWKASGRDLGAMMNLNCCGWYKAIESAVENGEIGQVRLIHGQKSYRMGVRPGFYANRETYGGTIPWVAIHAVDWVLRLGGPCEWVTAAHSTGENRGNGDMETACAIIMKLKNGVIGTVDADFFRPDGSARHDDDRLRVTGTKGMIEAINGRVWLENEEKRREIEVPEDENPFVRFVNGLGTENNVILAKQALDDARVCLYARAAADAGSAMRMSVEEA